MRVFFAIALVVIGVALVGCETESSDQISISISPNNATITKGQSVAFTASGWQDYTWSLSDTSMGVLSATKGDSTVYTAVTGPASTNATLTQIVTVSVNIPADGVSSATNTAALGADSLVTAQALVTITYAP